MNVERYDKGEVIVREGDSGDSMFFIRGGKVAAYASFGTPAERLLAELGRGDYFGEMSLLDHEGRSATIVSAEQGTTVSRITEAEFSEFLAESPGKVFDVLRRLSHKLRKITTEYVALCEEIESSEDGKFEQNEKLKAVHDAVQASKA
ncbi:MAG: cyclic nucleotide-binding domain-containing protein [Coriobacteriales bacterium]|nr:cyclic nucleotide-binding domain-containing protein [Coriobacteriales bacterium]